MIMFQPLIFRGVLHFACQLGPGCVGHFGTGHRWGGHDERGTIGPTVPQKDGKQEVDGSKVRISGYITMYNPQDIPFISS